MATKEESSTSLSALQKIPETERVATAKFIEMSENLGQRVPADVSLNAACKRTNEANSSNLRCTDSRTEASGNTYEYHDENVSTKTNIANHAQDKDNETDFQCNICFDKATNPVVSLCGHLFCWSCLNQWMQVRPNRKLCPVCRGGVDIEKVVPVYCHNSGQREDPRYRDEPCRPAAQRQEPSDQQNYLGLGHNDNVNMIFGIGAFPFAVFGASFNAGGPHLPAVFNVNSVLPNLFLYVAFLFLAWIIWA